MSNTTIKAIETRYKGYRFRSRLEARWAVFFDALGICWEYEKEGYSLPSGAYLPDFWLPDLDCWLEVKGDEPTNREELLCSELADMTHKSVYLFFGPICSFGDDDWIPESGYVYYPGDPDDTEGVTGGWDNFQAFCFCQTGQHIEIHYEGRGARVSCGCPGYVNGGRGLTDIYGKLHEARVSARSARFEHGENGPS